MGVTNRALEKSEEFPKASREYREIIHEISSLIEEGRRLGIARAGLSAKIKERKGQAGER